MKLVYQTRFGYPDGNCHAAALASILEIDLDIIPEFGINDDWYDNFSRYMVSHHALQPVDFCAKSLPERFTPRGFYIINGFSVLRNIHHCIVGFNGKPVHDPLPGGDCILSSVETYTVFIVLDPKSMAWENSKNKAIEKATITTQV